VTARPLEGRRIVVLRVGGDVDAVGEALVEQGAAATTISVGTVVDRSDAEVTSAVGALAQFRWAVVTSANAARRLVLWAARWPTSVRIAAVGPATAASVEGIGLEVATVAPGGTARSLAAEIDGGPVLFLAAASARDDLIEALLARSIDVTTVVVYDVVARELSPADTASLVGSEAVVAMSPRAIDALCGIDGDVRVAARAIPLIAIGPTTASHAEALGWPVAAVASSRAAGAVRAAAQLALNG